jgi:phosphatidylglycerol:prolipoprotein diacylglycerol transferase
MQAAARWGNFFNQELYGAPTNLPWGIAIQCQYRTQGYACPPGSDPTATLGQHFQPMFLYESQSGLLGAIALIWLARRFAGRLKPGDLLLVFFIWYGSVRFVVESLKADNWLFFGVPTAQIVAGITVGRRRSSSLFVTHVRHRVSRAHPWWIHPLDRGRSRR